MKTYLTALGLTALSSLQAVPKVEGSRFARVPVSSTASINNPMDDDTTALALRSPAEAGLERSLAVPHDVPSHPHCTYRGADSLMYMVFSKDFGRNDETSQDGCGNHMLIHLREECSDWIVSWECSATLQGEHSAFMEFKVPIQFSSVGPECVERAFRRASGPRRQQTVHCCKRGDLKCRKRNCEAYREENPDLVC
ncbi:hypothetical protein J7T55_002401 [Diaporthe amygdali]|uniref:uncharacterized protein n=1 Tax=Phomopsis amygdali TaxID=1214568 RepID=UPI0022FE8E93|nr:uncharacterized protein J7T55_002401 [Diaporthe amygdali]KAJ0121892.1 hypothetical protein J7T55_002401 [Diaporthe amygdali]